MDLVETLEALRPGHHYVQLLTAERDGRGRAECEALVGKALAHEHMRRRRCACCLALALRVSSHLHTLGTFTDPGTKQVRSYGWRRV